MRPMFTEDCDRHLKRKEEEAALMARPVGARKKRKKAAAEKRKEAIASDSSEGALKEEGEMLKLREGYWEAALLWEEKLVQALGRWLERKITQVPTVDSNKKKVVRIIMPNAYIDDIIENPDTMRGLSNEEMAEYLHEYRQSYATTKVINTKNHAYQQTLIAQYHAFGFAYDEKEVTDDEEEKVVKN